MVLHSNHSHGSPFVLGPKVFDLAIWLLAAQCCFHVRTDTSCVYPTSKHCIKQQVQMQTRDVMASIGIVTRSRFHARDG
jgi:hypothetical protein